MRSKRYLPALILTTALCLGSCSVQRTLDRESRFQQESRAAAEETARLRQDLVSLREEVRILEMSLSRTTNRTDQEAVETVTERFDTAGRILSRTTEHRDNRSTTTVDETSQAISQSVADSIGMVQTELDGERSEQAQSRTESEDRQKEETAPKKGLSWWQKTLTYCGGAALLWVAFRLCKPHLKGVLTAIKTFFISHLK